MGATVLDTMQTAPVETERSFAECGSTTDVANWFESRYRALLDGGDPPPWLRTTGPHPALVAWLNVEAPNLVRPGSRVLIADCGASCGCDVVELLNRGYDVVGVEPSPAAAQLAVSRWPVAEGALRCADLADPPSRFMHRFDLSVGVSLLASTPPALRERIARGLVEVTHPRGAILLIEPGCDQPPTRPEQPPAPLRPDELSTLVEQEGFRPTRPLDDFEATAAPAGRWLRGVFRRA